MKNIQALALLGLSAVVVSPVSSLNIPRSHLVSVYGVDHGGRVFGKFQLDSPGNVTKILSLDEISSYLTQFSAGCAASPSENFFYTIKGVGEGKEFIKLSKNGGGVVETLPFPLPFPSNAKWNDLEMDMKTNTLYGVAATCSDEAYLSTIDPATGNVTSIGTLPGIICPIGLAIDGDGTGWAIDMNSGGFYSINLATAETTLVHTFDVNSNAIHQGMTYDPITEEVYVMNFNMNEGETRFQVLDTATGDTQTVGIVGRHNYTEPHGYTYLGYANYLWIAFGLDPSAPRSCDYGHYDSGCCHNTCQDMVHLLRPELNCLTRWSKECASAACGTGNPICGLDVCQGSCVDSIVSQNKKHVVTTYGVDSKTRSFAKFELDKPEIVTKIGNHDEMFPGTISRIAMTGSAAFPSDPFVYMLGRAEFKKVSKADGSFLESLPFPSPPAGDQVWTDLEVNIRTGELYGVASTCSSGDASLAKIDPSSGSVTLIGNLTGLKCVMGFAIDRYGVGWAIDHMQDGLYSVNLSTAGMSLVGNLPAHNAYTGMGMSYDAITDEVYLMASNETTQETELEIVDRATATTSVSGIVDKLEWITEDGTNMGEALGEWYWITFGADPEAPKSCNYAHYDSGCCHSTCQVNVDTARPELGCLTRWSRDCAVAACGLGSASICATHECDGTCPVHSKSHLVTVYGMDSNTRSYASFQLDTPEYVTKIRPYDEIVPGTPSPMASAGCSAYPSDPFVYALEMMTAFYKVAKSDGSLLEMLPWPLPPSGQMWTDLQMDLPTGDLYGISATCGQDASALAKIDPTSGNVTLIGNLVGITCPIGFAIDGDGVGWLVDLNHHDIYSVNLTTAEGSLIGTLMDADGSAYGGSHMGMGYDPVTDAIYVMNNDVGNQVLEIRAIDTTTLKTKVAGNVGKFDFYTNDGVNLGPKTGSWYWVGFGVNPDAPRSCDYAHYDNGCCAKACQANVTNARPELDCSTRWSSDCVKAACGMGEASLCGADACSGSCDITMAPSSQPSNVASNEPSAKPSAVHSTSPTSFPTPVPSAKPSAVPSVDPSPLPTTRPTATVLDAGICGSGPLNCRGVGLPCEGDSSYLVCISVNGELKTECKPNLYSPGAGGGSVRHCGPCELVEYT